MKTHASCQQIPTAFSAAIIIAVNLFAAHFSVAATRIWNGGAVPDGNWMTPGNWNGVSPATNDLLVFAGSTQTATTNNFPSGTPFNNISFDNGASAFTVNGNSMTLSEPTDAGSGQISGGSILNLSAANETLRIPIFIADGNHRITSGGGGTLNLNGPITRSTAAVVTMSGDINVTGGLSTNGNLHGILGGWAIYNFNWATLDGSSIVVAYTDYMDVAGGGTIASDPSANVRIPASGAAISISAGTTAINSLLYSGGTAAQTVNVGADNKLVLGQNGGIYNSSSIASGGTYRNLVIGPNVAGGGILTAGDGINPATITFGSPPLASGSSGFLTVHSSIQDNGNAPVSVVIAGAYVSLNGAGPAFGAFPTNTYSGGTYIVQGRFSQANPYTIGTGPVHIFPGGQVNCGWQITNDFYIEGSGTTENNGMGALRLYSASLVNGVTGNLPGTIHLTGDANVCADNITVASQMIGFSGRITGPGSLGIGSPTATTRSGIINIGSTNGAFAIPNDYAGDTRINGINGGSISSTLRIADPANNNIMPHGTTGSHAGGRTGNLILNATTDARQAIFDLNGSTQTINGLSSTATSPANNLIQDNGTGDGTLIVGDSDATSTFGGMIQNSIRLTKIGNGTLTLSGANSYNGDTLISAGRLVTTTASSGAGNFSIAANAALGVTVASAGSTLQIASLTNGTSALELNAGTFGNPIAAVVNVGGALAMNGNVTISLSGVGLTAGGPFPILTYNAASRNGAGIFVLNNSPRVVATLNDDNAGNVTMTIISADSAVKWNGGAGGDWDVNNAGNAIWQTVPSGGTTHYIEAGSGNDSVLFNDTLTGTPNVNLTTTLSPQSITVSNSAVNYLFTGTGRLSGAAGLTKEGAGALTIANSGNNDFSGDIALTAGTLVISNDSLIANNISGSGALTKSGSGTTLTLSGDNSLFTGPVAVNGGTLQVLNSASLGSASALTIANGATLDIGLNSVTLGVLPITVSGSGVNGNGAIVNSSGHSGGAIATSFQNVTLTGDTAIGGPGRLDFRATDPAGGDDATLSTGGQARKLTKLSGNLLQLAGVQIDPALGDIDVQAGIFSIQGNMPSLGNAANTITVFSDATLQFASVFFGINKVLILRDGGIVNNSSGDNFHEGAVTLQGNGLFNVGGSSLTITNVISGPGSLSKVTGAGLLYLSASNTYTGDTIISAGTLALSGDGSFRHSPTITIGTGATLDLNTRTDGALTLTSGQTLKGSGTVSGILIAGAGSTVSPGTSIGTLTTLTDVTLQGNIVIEIDKSHVTINDQLFAGGQIHFGGTLTVMNIGPEYADGDSFTLFNGAGYTGAFAIQPAIPGAGLAWNTNNLAVDGTLSVVSTQPAIQSVVLNGMNLEVGGTFGTGSGQYYVLASTNAALPATSWTRIATNSFDAGTFNFTNAITPGVPQRYFLLQLP
jgi:fibronectin-binding autotransporter adhesin